MDGEGQGSEWFGHSGTDISFFRYRILDLGTGQKVFTKR